MTAKNISASVRQRLLNLAKASSVDFNQMLIRHAIERLLFRLATSSHASSFILKGAMLFVVWRGSPHRPTQDLDLLGYGDPSPERLTQVFKNLCVLSVDEDGWDFDAGTVTAEPIRATGDYGGMRVHVTGKLGSAVVRLQIDVGFGDAVTPAPVQSDYPVLLGQPIPHLKVYPVATVVAEKIESITKLGMLNTRFKDYYDLRFLAERFEFQGNELVSALKATFDRRGTQFPQALPTGLTAIFAQDAMKQQQWSAFAHRVSDSPTMLSSVVDTVADFIEQPLEAVRRRSPFHFYWHPSGPWIKQ